MNDGDQVSSSTTRIRLLGGRLSPALRDWMPECGPYMVRRKDKSVHDSVHRSVQGSPSMTRLIRWG